MGGLSLYRGVCGRRTQNFGNYSRGIVILQTRMVPKVKRGHGGRVCPPETSFHHVNSSHWLTFLLASSIGKHVYTCYT